MTYETPISDARRAKRLAARGWWGMPCWNALSHDQQRRLIEVGNLEILSEPEGDGCTRSAEIAIETQDDEAPGLRFYCRPCGIAYLTGPGSADDEQ